MGIDWLLAQPLAIVLLAGALLLGLRDRPAWVSGAMHRQIVADRDKQIADATKKGEEWQRIALATTNLAQIAVRERSPQEPPR